MNFSFFSHRRLRKIARAGKTSALCSSRQRDGRLSPRLTAGFQNTSAPARGSSSPRRAALPANQTFSRFAQNCTAAAACDGRRASRPRNPTGSPRWSAGRPARSDAYRRSPPRCTTPHRHRPSPRKRPLGESPCLPARADSPSGNPACARAACRAESRRRAHTGGRAAARPR